MKKRSLLCILLCISLSACQGEVPEENLFLEKYREIFVRENAQRAALIYLDEDFIPELVLLKNGGYRLYSFDGSKATALDMPDVEIRANAYGPRHYFEESEDPAFYWFEYVPHKGLLRVHGGNLGERERKDYYLRYTGDSLKLEFAAYSTEYAWHTYEEEKEIANEEFISKISDLGYDGLTLCGYLFDNIETAYENIDLTSDTKGVLEDFVNGERDALDHVEGISDIPEEGFVMRSYRDYYDYITAGDEQWGRLEYIDFDNDGDEELILHGYCGACDFFDVAGDTVYKVLETGTTTNVAYVTEREGKKVIVGTDLTHAGRKSYIVMTYDACCCLTDWFQLSAAYEGTEYASEDEFMYRNRKISMEEYEGIRDSIQ